MAESAPSTKPLAPVLYAFETADQLSSRLADFIIKAQDEAVSSKKGVFRLAISGGSLPKTLNALIGRPEVKWDKWRVFFADERLVPLHSEDSNFYTCNEELFSKVPELKREYIHTIDEKLLREPEELSDEYEKQLMTAFAGKDSVAFPRFDLVLLGMGPDGHTCSLFPGHALLNEELRWVAWLDDSPKPPPTRITLTFPVLRHAHRVAFVASGAGKQEVLAQALDHPGELPCSKIKPAPPGQVFWFTDLEAAKQDKATTYPLPAARVPNSERALLLCTVPRDSTVCGRQARLCERAAASGHILVRPQTRSGADDRPTGRVDKRTTANNRKVDNTLTFSRAHQAQRISAGSKHSMSELKLRRLTEHNQRLREDLERPRVRVSEASASLIQYCKSTRDHLCPSIWGPLPKNEDPYAPVAQGGCCTIM
ncbi:hypothetical protein E5Q_05611 [Mixia osmundae IAM 14324]|uniref:Guanine nucleotide-binding protein subunit gamma n=1 Tax=Mixia osmundae (strain CBS 9802 / IAM 14324 / JCM 22182 / KY 12970) TaxID=764103 RepID=G7E7W3_MIXOS|nr:hypothetical protein E5Q_05611 [Mixia osmundae IAM 14324]